jgi:hypothetical protein
MTDRELLELAARAAGIKLEQGYGQPPEKCLFYLDEDGCHDWNPLDDDGDALRLSVKLEIAVNPYAGKTVVANEDIRWLGHEKWDCHDDNACAATRHAIVRAAAEIGKEMK